VEIFRRHKEESGIYFPQTSTQFPFVSFLHKPTGGVFYTTLSLPSLLPSVLAKVLAKFSEQSNGLYQGGVKTCSAAPPQLGAKPQPLCHQCQD